MVRYRRDDEAGRGEVIVKVTDEKQTIALDYLARRLQTTSDDITFGSPFTVFVTCKGTDARGVILYKNYSSGDIEMVCAGKPGWVTPEVLRFSLSYPFKALNCNRITCLAHRKNKGMRDYLVRMGFRLEGVKRKALNGADLMIYGLLREENPWA